MSDLIKFARPYAKAAFQVARDEGQLSEWSAMLEASSTIVADETLNEAINNPNVSREQAVDLILAAAGDRFDAQYTNMLRLLAENGRLTVLPEIQSMYEQLRQEEEKRLSVRVVSAVALSDDQAERMKAALSKRFDREISLETQTDAAMLGGAIIYAGDMVIDGSVRGRLRKLATQLAE